MTGPERDRQSSGNAYRRVWVPIAEVASLNLVAPAAKALLVEAADSGWAADRLEHQTLAVPDSARTETAQREK